MKRLLCTAMSVAAVLGLAQSIPQFSSGDGNITLRFKSFQTRLLAKGQTQYRVQGSVEAVSRSQGLKMNAAQAACVTNNHGKVTVLQSMIATGNVRTEKTSPQRQTVITSSKADYRYAPVESQLKVIGGVNIQDKDSRLHRTTVITGSVGTVRLASENKKGVDSFRGCTLTGGVKITVQQVSAKGATGNLTASGDRLTMDRTKKPSSVIISGHVLVDYLQDGKPAKLRGLPSIVLELNDKDEVTNIRGGQS